MSGPTKKIVEGNVTTEIFDLSEGQAGDIDTEAIMQRMGGQGGSFTEVRPDGTRVTYEIDVEEEEIEVRMGFNIRTRIYSIWIIRLFVISIRTLFIQIPEHYPDISEYCNSYRVLVFDMRIITSPSIRSTLYLKDGKSMAFFVNFYIFRSLNSRSFRTHQRELRSQAQKDQFSQNLRSNRNRLPIPEALEAEEEKQGASFLPPRPRPNLRHPQKKRTR